MTTAEVQAAVAIVLGLGLALPALALLLRALFPDATRRAEEQVRTRPGRSLLAGVLVVVPAIFGVATLGQLPGPAKPASGLLLALLFLYSFLGVSGLAGHVGARLPSPGDAARPWLAVLRGAVVLEAPCGLPFVGWFVLAPTVLATGAGATTLALLSGAGPAASPAAPGARERETSADAPADAPADALALAGSTAAASGP